MKKFLYSFLFSLCCMTSVVFGNSPYDSFSDVSESHEYYAPIQWVKYNGIVKGYADGEYKPDNTISRAEFIKILILSKNAVWSIDTNVSASSFIDVSSADWFTSYANFAQKNSIIEGYSDGSFGPQKTINFAEASKIIALLHLDYNAEKYTCASHWWCGFEQAFEEKNIPTFSGDHLITRGEMANILYKIYTDGFEGFPNNTTIREDEIEILLNGLRDPSDTAIFGLDNYSIVRFVDTINGKNFYVASLTALGPAPDILVYVYDDNGALQILGELNSDSGFYYNDYNKDDMLEYIQKNDISFGASLPEKYFSPNTLSLSSNTSLNQETTLPFFANNFFELNPYLLKTGLVATDGKEIFTDDRNALIVRTDDFVSHRYSLDIPFLEDRQIAQISWDNFIDSGKYDEEYRKGYSYQKQGGCGSENYMNVVTSERAVQRFDNFGADIFIDPEKDLHQTGVGKNGEKIYEFKDANHIFLQDMYENKYHDYDSKISYESFLSVHPVFFWKDELGRWIMFESNRFIPQAECGKPVIYLYPETETDVHVRVAPKGGFSITIPEHGENGWNVIAKPNGDLTEKTTGEKYPYLFWEGKGGIYESPKKGWVIEKYDADIFVAGKLTQFGFNSQEIFDFLEFWSPRLQEGEDTYLFISFWGTDYMNSIAPIEITPKPDSILRVLMDFHETKDFYEVESFSIPKFERKGFAVTEWGGTLWTK